MKKHPLDSWIAPYRKRQNLRLLATLALLGGGYMIIMRTGPMLGGVRMTMPMILLLVIGVLMEYAGMISLILTLIHRWILHTARWDSTAVLSARGLLDDAVHALSSAARTESGGLCFACTKKYLYLPHGAVYPIQEVLWISPEEDTVRFLFIPLVHMHWHALHMADGSQAIAFYGKAQRQSEMDSLIRMLKEAKDDLLTGSAAQDEWQYFSRIRGKKE